MPPKKKGNRNNKAPVSTKRELVLRQELEEYAQIRKLMGDRRLKLVLPDGSETISTIRGCFGRRCWMKEGEVVLTQEREYQKGKLDVIYKYTREEANSLYKMGHIPFSFLNGGGDFEMQTDKEDIVRFDHSSDDEFFTEDNTEVPDDQLKMDLPPKDLPPLENDDYYNPIAGKIKD